jgi:hypothetical protein
MVARMPAALLLTLLLLTLLPAAAGAEIVPGKSIAGIEVGMKKAKVIEILGQPDETNRANHEIFGAYTELVYGKTTIGLFDSNRRVFNVTTRSRSERTDRNIGVGSTKRAVRRRVEGVKCEIVQGFRHCYLGRFVPVKIVMDFVLNRDNRVRRITLARVID